MNTCSKSLFKHNIINTKNRKRLNIKNDLQNLNVVLDLDKCLVHIKETKTVKIMNRQLSYFEIDDFTVAKRPNINYFLWSLVENEYNVYMYSDRKYEDTKRIVDKLENDVGIKIFEKIIYQDSFVDFDHSMGKDLRNLKLDLKRTILIDDDPKNFKKQPLNGVYIKQFVDDNSNEYIDLSEDLYHILGFLKTIKCENDVRDQDLEIYT